MKDERRSPAELRSMFGANLRSLAQSFPSISELSRQLGINRTQFNRYLAGESFPRPDVLARICDFFDVDARVLLESVDDIENRSDLLSGDFLGGFLGAGVYDVPEVIFPSGFFRFSRRSFLDPDQYVIGLVRVWRNGAATCLRGLEAREAMVSQGIRPTREAREFRGIVMQQEEGVSALISRKGSKTASFNFMTRAPSMDNNFWSGYVTRTVPETPGAQRVLRMVYEYVGTDFASARAAARQCGYCSEAELMPFHKRLLKTDQPFT
jgi:transcriptional regulator with XRE-family HTH domain